MGGQFWHVYGPKFEADAVRDIQVRCAEGEPVIVGSVPTDVTEQEFADLAGFPLGMAQLIIASKRIKTHRVGGVPRISKDDVVAYFHEQNVAAAVAADAAGIGDTAIRPIPVTYERIVEKMIDEHAAPVSRAFVVMLISLYVETEEEASRFKDDYGVVMTLDMAQRIRAALRENPDEFVAAMQKHGFWVPSHPESPLDSVESRFPVWKLNTIYKACAAVIREAAASPPESVGDRLTGWFAAFFTKNKVASELRDFVRRVTREYIVDQLMDEDRPRRKPAGRQ